jgi:predicted TIM-barrel fold metal-dependent hydrolase
MLRADLAQRGTSAAVIFTGRLLNAAMTNDYEYAAALGRAYNRCLAERWIDPSSGIYGTIMAVNQVPEEAAQEIERFAKTKGFVAVYLPSSGNYPLWGDKCYAPIFAAAQEAELPVVVQGTLTVHTVFPYQMHHLPTALGKQALSQLFGAQANLVSLVVSGTLAQFPRLKVIFNDAGIGWLPVLLGRLDHYYPYLRKEVPFLDDRPSEIIRRQVYLTTHPLDGLDPALLRACLESLGYDHVLFGSDWPHFDAGHPDQIRDLPIPADAKELVLGGNARALFGIDQLGLLTS